VSIGKGIARTAAVIGILAVPVVGIAVIPDRNSPGDRIGISSTATPTSEGDSSASPHPTVTQNRTETVQTTPMTHVSPTAACPAVTYYVHVPGPTVTKYVDVPGPTVTRIVIRTVAASPSVQATR
jgi:hypothetical protein